MNADFFDELVELRIALKEIKANTEEFITHSAQATQSLQTLNEKLATLRALKPYKEA